jgi:hypothetical protein
MQSSEEVAERRRRESTRKQHECALTFVLEVGQVSRHWISSGPPGSDTPLHFGKRTASKHA